MGGGEGRFSWSKASSCVNYQHQWFYSTIGHSDYSAVNNLRLVCPVVLNPLCRSCCALAAAEKSREEAGSWRGRCLADQTTQILSGHYPARRSSQHITRIRIFYLALCWSLIPLQRWGRIVSKGVILSMRWYHTGCKDAITSIQLEMLSQYASCLASGFVSQLCGPLNRSNFFRQPLQVLNF